MRQLVHPQRRFDRASAAGWRVLGVVGLMLASMFAGLMVAYLPPGFLIRILAIPLFLGFVGLAWMMRSTSAGLPGPWTIALLMGTTALSIVWPRYIFFSIGGPFINPLTACTFLSLAMCVAWIVYSPALGARMSDIAKKSGGVLWLIGLWLVWRLLASLAGPYPEASTFEYLRDQVYLSTFLLVGWVLVARPDGIQSLLRLLLACALLVTAAGCVEALLQKNHFIQFAAGRDSQSVAATLKVLAIEKFRDGGFRIQSTFDHPIVFAQFIAAMVPIALFSVVHEKKLLWRGVAFSFLAISLYALYKTGSRAGVASLAVCLAFLLVVGWLKLMKSRGYGKAIAFAALPLALAGLGLVYWALQELAMGRSRVEASSTSVRLQMLSLGFEALKESPILGFGHGSALAKAGIFDRASGAGTIDSFLLSVAVDAGYVGLLLLLVFFGIFCVKGVQRALRSSGRDSLQLSFLLAAAVAIFTTFTTLSITSNFTLFWLILMAALCSFSAGDGTPKTRS